MSEEIVKEDSQFRAVVVEHYRNRKTGGGVVLWRVLEKPESVPEGYTPGIFYVVLCNKHERSIDYIGGITEARYLVHHPWEFCDGCQSELDTSNIKP
jgi:hypothetical protein